MFFSQNIAVTGSRYKEITESGGFFHGHHIVAVHQRFQRFDFIDFRYDHSRAHGFGSQRKTPADPAVTGDNNGLTSYEEIGGGHNGSPGRLTGTVTVIEEMFAIGVVHRDHGEVQFVFGRHGAKTVETRRCFFTAADDIFQQFPLVMMKNVNEVTAVINDELRFVFQRCEDAGVIKFRVGAVNPENMDPEIGKCSGDIILSGKRIAAGQSHFGAHFLQCQSKATGFRLDMETDIDPHPGKGFFVFIAFNKQIQYGHMFFCPV